MWSSSQGPLFGTARNRYTFENVLVADTRILQSPIVDSPKAGAAAKPPEVLVLNSKINKCLATEFSNAVCPGSCCLRAQRSEFRRRSSLAEPIDECFARCSERRPMRIELQAEAQLSGKLVILALTRPDPGIALTCHAESTWAFARFEPHAADALAWGSPMGGADQRHAPTAQQLFYARLDSFQAPSILVDALQLGWRPGTTNETVTLAVRSSAVTKRHQFIVRQETLLVSQFHCKPSPPARTTNETATATEPTVADSANDLDAGLDELSSPMAGRKLHLLALINREPSHQPFPGGVPAARGTSRAPAVPVVDQPPVVSAKSADEKPPRRPSSTTVSPTTAIARSSDTFLGEQTGAHSPLPSKQPDEAPNTVRGSHLRNVLRHQPALKPHNQTTTQAPEPLPKRIQDRIELASTGTNTLGAPMDERGATLMSDSKMGPTYLISEIDSIRLRLRSSSFLMVTLSSSLVILIYTLCLLIYFKCRHKARPATRLKSRTVSSSASDSSSAGAEPMNISSPYNLQMAPATRMRLDAMLGKANPPNLGHQIHLSKQQRARPFRCGHPLNRPTNSRSPLVVGLQHGKVPNDTGNIEPTQPKNRRFRANSTTSSSEVMMTVHDEDQAEGIDQESSGPFVRAVRQAASLARSRIRYQPNLNVIPESDLEQLQSRPKRYAAAKILSESESLLLPGCMTSEQFDSFVQEAMSSECSHNVGSRDDGRYNQHTATLFAKPTDDAAENGDRSQSNESRVSRKRILKHAATRHDSNLYEQHGKPCNTQL